MPWKHHYVKSPRLRMVRSRRQPTIPHSLLREARTEILVIELVASGVRDRRLIAEKTGISYGWAKKVVRDLIAAEVLVEQGGQVFIAEV